MCRLSPPRRRGLTLLELLLVTAILAVLLALILPAVQKARETASRLTCQNKMKQLALAMHNYHGAYQSFPPGFTTYYLRAPDTMPKASALHVSYPCGQGAPWSVLILPFLEDDARYRTFDLQGGFTGSYQDIILQQTGAIANPCSATMTDNPNFIGQKLYFTQKNLDALFQPNAKFQCPSDPNSRPEVPNSNYVAVMGGANGGAADTSFWAQETSLSDQGSKVFYNNGVIYINSKTRLTDITDGTTNVFLLGETWYMATPTSARFHYGTWAGTVYGSGGPNGNSGCCLGAVTMSAANDPINNGLNVTESYDFDDGFYHGPFDPGVPWGSDSVSIMRGFGSKHLGGCNFATADGAVKFVSQKMDVNLYRQLATRADGLPAGGSP